MFQKTIVSKYLKTQNQEELHQKWTLFCNHFKNPTVQENIRNSKEEQYQEGFLRDLFVDVFGYTLNPTVGFNLTTELRNIKDTKKADGGIIIDEKVVGVIELKGTNTTDLGKIEQQAFNYKNNQIGCIYVITSNFEKLRFYVEDTIHFQEFNLFDLSQEDFNLLYLFLNFDNLQNNVPKKIKDESVSQEDVITKKLYKDYSVFKRELFQNFVQQNPDHNQLELFKKTQKLLDRLLFLFFGEDRGLLPPNSVRQILEQWNKLNDLDEYVPLYNRFKKYFGYLNTGFKGKNHDVFAYNGGLFKPDEILDVISIDDDLLYKHTLKLSEYDFASEVDVNILGHIFENSLNEIDEIKSQLEGKETDKSKTKRKKDGVFYTPKYITKYIVENTVGKLCEEKKTEFGIVEEDYSNDKKRQQKTKENLLQKLDEYRKWLLQITIVDPACGSGAFLNEALNFLIEEHRYIDEMESKLTGSSISFSYHSESILENNLFGVDLNEESVEIAKLSLWLRTAEPNRKLNNLNDNIKCGNSLIDDPEVAGDKAFSWEKEFPQVFAKGGFDVVIGNPPYVFARDNFDDGVKMYFSKNYQSAKYQVNTYILFIERSFKILNYGGSCGLIIPNSWLMTYSGEGIREFLIDNTTLSKIVNLTGYSFEDANVETVIVIGRNHSREEPLEILVNKNHEFITSHFKNLTDFKLNDGFAFNVFNDDISKSIIEKLFFGSVKLDEIVEIKAGLQAYEKGKGEPKQSESDVINRPYDFNYAFDSTTFPYLEGADVGRYSIRWSGQYLKYGNNLAAPRTINLFDGNKIIIREITGKYPKSIVATFTDELFLFNRSNIGIISKENSDINLRYIIAILNSKLISYYFLKNTAKSVRKLFPKLILNDLRGFPFKKITVPMQVPFIDKANHILFLNKELKEVTSKFQRTLTRKFEGISFSKKLQDWYNLSYPEFIKELSKQKIKLSLSEEAEWEDYFSQEKQKALDIKNTIDATDKEIDQMVYELYGLTEEEIEIVENS